MLRKGGKTKSAMGWLMATKQGGGKGLTKFKRRGLGSREEEKLTEAYCMLRPIHQG